MKAKPLWLALAGSVVLSLGGIATASAKTIDVVTSFTVLSDVVRHVGGDHVNVTSLVPPNGDPHAFEPSPEDAKAVGSAAVSFISGEGLENWFERLAEASGAKIDPVVVSSGIQTHTFEEDGHTVTDPHVWNSIPNVLIWVDNIEKALIAADPEDADAFKDNAEAYRQSLRTLNEQIHQQMGAIPEAQRKVLTSHDAFGYYGQEYGVTFLSPLGMSTETEASAADIAQLIDQIKAQHIKVYFIENSNSARLVKQIAEATHAKPGGELYPEALSEADGPAPSYEALMRYNTHQIVQAITSK